MGKAVMISIRPEWVAKIAAGQKTIEVRKSKPSTLSTPFKCYIYCAGGKPLYIGESLYCKEHKSIVRFSKDGKSIPFRNGIPINGRVIGEFVCDYIRTAAEPADGLVDVVDCENSCLTPKEIIKYADGGLLFFWHISDLKIYVQPKILKNFMLFSKDRPCKSGTNCCYDYFDYAEGCRACGISFDGAKCELLQLSKPPQSWCYVDELPE